MSAAAPADRRSLALLVVSAACAGSVAILVARNPGSFDWAVVRLAWLAVLMLVGGATVGSERTIAFSAGPVALGLVLAAGQLGQPAWAESLVAGCGWFAAIEAALASIESRGGSAPNPSVLMRRIVEVATVVALAAAVALVALLLESYAPERSVLVRATMAATVLLGLFAVARRLSARPFTSPPESR